MTATEQRLVGTVLKAYNSFFYVETEDGVISSKLRGKFKKKDMVCPGDRVVVVRLEDGTGVLEELCPRKNLLKRPLVANIDQVLLTFATTNPDPHPAQVAKLVTLAEWSHIPTIAICVNKMDLVTDDEDIFSLYEHIGYTVFRVSAEERRNVEDVAAFLQHKVTVLAGPSGVGKSSLLNQINHGLDLRTGDVSAKIKRGKHTTRVSELLPFAGGYLVDTPGFSAMELEKIEKQELPHLFREFVPYLGQCRFKPCTHSHEPDCAIKKAVENGMISKARYEAFLMIQKEIDERKRTYR